MKSPSLSGVAEAHLAVWHNSAQMHLVSCWPGGPTPAKLTLTERVPVSLFLIWSLSRYKEPSLCGPLLLLLFHLICLEICKPVTHQNRLVHTVHSDLHEGSVKDVTGTGTMALEPWAEKCEKCHLGSWLSDPVWIGGFLFSGGDTLCGARACIFTVRELARCHHRAGAKPVCSPCQTTTTATTALSFKDLSPLFRTSVAWSWVFFFFVQ